MTQIKTFSIIDEVNEWLSKNDVEVIELKLNSVTKVVTGPYLNTTDEYGNGICLKQGALYNSLIWLLVYKTN